MNRTSEQTTQKHDRQIALALALLCFAVILATSNLDAYTLDEISVYTAARNLAGRGSFDADILYWLRDVQGAGAVIAPGVDGHQYVVKDVGPSLLATPLVAGARLVGINPVRAAFLLSPALTALTVALFYSFTRWWGFSRGAAVPGALTFGLGSMAWVYGRTLFTQPLTALGLLMALDGVIRARESGSWRWALVGGAGAGLAMLGSWSTVIVGPVYAAYLVRWESLRCDGLRAVLRRDLPLLLALAAGIAPFLLFVMIFNAVRFGSPLENGLPLNVSEFSGQPSFSLSYMPLGLIGQTISTPRGVIWYAPFVLLVPSGLVIGVRSGRGRVLALIAAQVVVLLVFTSCYIFWNSGISHGPRQMANVMPALALLCVPLFDRMAAGRFRVWHPAVYAVLAISMLTQAWMSLSYDHDLQYERYRLTYPLLDPQMSIRDFWDPALLPQAELFNGLENRRWTVVWMKDGVPDRAAPVGGLAAIGVSVTAVWIALSRRGRIAQAAVAVQTAAAAGLAGFLLVHYPQMGPDDLGLGELSASLEAQAKPEDAVLAVVPYTYWNWIATYSGRVHDYGLNYQMPLTDDTAALLERVSTQYERVWLVTGGVMGAYGENGVERWLADCAFMGPTTWFGNHYRLVPYTFASGEMTLQPVEQAFGDGSLRLMAAAWEQRDSWLNVWLRWEATSTQPTDYNVFVHVLGADWQLLAQHDGPPMAGYAPISGWTPGVPVDDRHHVPLPPDMPPGEYRLTVGLYYWQTGDRLRLVDDSGDVFELGVFTIEGR